jgi:hypothetical protein
VVDERPFEDVEMTGDGFSIPELKWREIVFVGGVRRDGEAFVRDPSRPLPPFARASCSRKGSAGARRSEVRARLRRL